MVCESEIGTDGVVVSRLRSAGSSRVPSTETGDDVGMVVGTGVAFGKGASTGEATTTGMAGAVAGAPTGRLVVPALLVAS